MPYQRKSMVPQCSITYLEKAMSSIRLAFADDKGFLEFIEPKYAELKGTFNISAISYCFENYINAELDFETPGVRGLGRMSTYIPRLGAYFKNQISRLSKEDLNELYEIIQDILLKGYLVHALGSGQKLEEGKIKDPQTLYKAWIPKIYSSGLDQLEEGFRNILSISVESAYRALLAFLQGHKMKGGGVFSKDKTDEIFIYYALAGFILRVVEVRGSPDHNINPGNQ